MYEDVAGKRVLIVGASGGIGCGLCHALNDLGAEVIATSRNIEKLQNSFERLGIGAIETKKCDIIQTDEVLALAKELNPVDALCIVAGSTKLVPNHMLKRSIIDSQLSVNLSGPIDLISAMLRFKKFKTGASIVTTSASARYNGVAATIPYVAAKNALVAVTRSLSAELAPKKIRVNTVSFDFVQTDMSRDILDHFQKTGNEDAQTIVGVSPIENAALPYVFLISEASKWMTGQVLSADSGRRLTRIVYG